MGMQVISNSQGKRLLYLLARVLPTNERIAVLGDLQEEGRIAATYVCIVNKADVEQNVKTLLVER